MSDGDKIVYIKEDSGQVLDIGLHLVPGEEMTVGLHVSPELAARLVEDGVCRPATASADDTQFPLPEGQDRWAEDGGGNH